MEVKVGSLDLSVDEYITLLPQSSLQTVAESKTGRNRTKLAKLGGDSWLYKAQPESIDYQ